MRKNAFYKAFNYLKKHFLSRNYHIKTTLKGKHTVSTEKKKTFYLSQIQNMDYRIAYYLTTVFKKLTIMQEMNDNYRNSLCTTHNVRGQ